MTLQQLRELVHTLIQRRCTWANDFFTIKPAQKSRAAALGPDSRGNTAAQWAGPHTAIRGLFLSDVCDQTWTSAGPDVHHWGLQPVYDEKVLGNSRYGKREALLEHRWVCCGRAKDDPGCWSGRVSVKDEGDAEPTDKVWDLAPPEQFPVEEARVVEKPSVPLVVQRRPFVEPVPTREDNDKEYAPSSVPEATFERFSETDRDSNEKVDAFLQFFRNKFDQTEKKIEEIVNWATRLTRLPYALSIPYQRVLNRFIATPDSRDVFNDTASKSFSLYLFFTQMTNIIIDKPASVDPTKISEFARIIDDAELADAVRKLEVFKQLGAIRGLPEKFVEYFKTMTKGNHDLRRAEFINAVNSFFVARERCIPDLRKRITDTKTKIAAWQTSTKPKDALWFQQTASIIFDEIRGHLLHDERQGRFDKSDPCIFTAEVVMKRLYSLAAKAALYRAPRPQPSDVFQVSSVQNYGNQFVPVQWEMATGTPAELPKKVLDGWLPKANATPIVVFPAKGDVRQADVLKHYLKRIVTFLTTVEELLGDESTGRIRAGEYGLANPIIGRAENAMDTLIVADAAALKTILVPY